MGLHQLQMEIMLFIFLSNLELVPSPMRLLFIPFMFIRVWQYNLMFIHILLHGSWSVFIFSCVFFFHDYSYTLVNHLMFIHVAFLQLAMRLVLLAQLVLSTTVLPVYQVCCSSGASVSINAGQDISTLMGTVLVSVPAWYNYSLHIHKCKVGCAMIDK